MKIWIISVLFVLIASMGLISNVSAEGNLVPTWIKSIAKFWSEGNISDSEFIGALQFMVENKIIQIPKNTESIEDKGDFFITYHPNPNSIYEYSAMDLVVDSQYFELNIEYLNGLFALPHDIEIQLVECDVANAFYYPQTKQITMCYELIDSVYDDFLLIFESEIASGLMTENDIIIMTQDVMDFVFYHELGHALIDVYELPITGLEENAVDQFATLFMLITDDLEGHDGIVGQDILYNVGTWFFIKNELYDQSYFWDVHNLDIQRFYNISCYAYGQHPEYNQDLITDGYLPEERAQSCEYEYSLMNDSWTELLSKYYL